MTEMEIIPFYTREAQDIADFLIEDTKDEVAEIEEMKSFVKDDYSMQNPPTTDDFLDMWREISKPDQEYDFFESRLEQVMEDHNLPEMVYADMYDEFTMFPENAQMAETVIGSLRTNDIVTPALAGQLYNFMNVSQAARRAQIQDFQRERQKLDVYEEHLEEVVDDFEDMNTYPLPLDVDNAVDFWDRLESFDDRMGRIRTSRQNDYEAENYNAVNLYGFLSDVYEEEIGVRQPVMADADAVDARTTEARDNIVI